MAELVQGVENLAVATATVVGDGAATGVVAGSADPRTAQGKVLVEVRRGRDLVAKDRGFMRSGKSDPYCKITLACRPVGTGKTKTIDRNLSPTWNWSGVGRVNENRPRELVVAIFDKDSVGADDPMGTVRIDVGALQNGVPSVGWHDVLPCDGCANAKGQIELSVTFVGHAVVKLSQGLSFDVDPDALDRRLVVGLGWTGAYGSKVDLDASCVFFDASGNYVDALYFGNTACFGGAATHSGDARTGDEALAEDAADERMEVSLAALPRAVASMLFVVTAYQEKASFVDMKSAFVGLWDPVEGECCRFSVDCAGAHTALAMCRLARSRAGSWVLNAIGDVAAGPRDYGSWLPELKGYLKDLVPSIKVGDANDRVAIMHKGGVVDLSAYSATPLATVCMGLAWDITRGRNIDLDASAILLGPDLGVVEIVSFSHLKSNDGTVKHSGDDRSGDGGGDDEIITVELNMLPPHVAHVGFVVCSYSGQHFAAVNNTACHLFTYCHFNPRQTSEMAKFKLAGMAQSDLYRCTGLVMAILSRGFSATTGQPTWFMRAAGEGCSGKVAKDCIDEVQEYIQTGAIRPR